MGAVKQNKTIINRIIQACLEELEADKLLPVNHPQKLGSRQRTQLLNKIERLEMSKKWRRDTPAAAKVKASPTGRTLVPRGPQTVIEIAPAEAENSKPDPKASDFLNKVKAING